MSTDTNFGGLTIHHAIHPDRDNQFRAIAVSSKFLKESQKMSHVRCTQCQISLDKPSKCAKCKSVWYCSKECQKKHWPTHKPRCHDVERSSGAFKFIRMFVLNPVLMGFLRVAITIRCDLIDNPRIGIDVPFGVRVDVAIEPSDILDFIGLYFNKKPVGEKLQGMVQVNAITPWEVELTPERLKRWREARARYDAEGFAKDPVGFVDFIDVSCTEDSGNSAAAELHFPPIVLDIAKERQPFLSMSAITGTEFERPMNTASCLESINMHIRADKENQLHLRTEMTDQDKDVIRAAGRNEDTYLARILKEKMQKEIIYASFALLTHLM